MDSITVEQRWRGMELLSRSVPFPIARQVEAGIYSAFEKQQCDYNAKVLQLAYNLKVNGTQLLSQHTTDVLPYLTDEVLAEGTAVQQWWQLHDRKLEQQRKMLYDEAKFEEGEQLNFAALICNRCHSRSISVQQQQIRSADEGMTVFCTCNKCGIRWKM